MIKHGFLEKERTQRYRCKSCTRTFSDAAKRIYGLFRIPNEKVRGIVTALTEGSSIRGTARMIGVHRDTVLSVLKFAGERAENLLKKRLVDIVAEHVEVDEIWTYVMKRRKGYVNPEKDASWMGDYYVFTGMDSATKLMFIPVIGKRTELNTEIFMQTLAQSIKGRTQITTDGFRAYPKAVKKAFGNRVDFAQYYKEYNMLKKRFPKAYVSASELHKFKDSVRAKASDKPFLVRCGNPDPKKITTSRIERSNLTFRTFCKRMNRATICFSRDEEYLHCATMLFIADYNFVKLHAGLRRKTTPAMAAGVADRIFGIEDLLREGV